MTSFARIYLDTNIFIYAFEEKGPRSDLLSAIFAGASAANSWLVTSELVLSELLVKPYRHADDIAIEQYESFVVTSEWLDVLAISRLVLLNAAELRARYRNLKLPDAIHLSAAMAAGCSHFLTADEGLSGQIEIINWRPASARKAPSIHVIRPDEPTLTSLLQSLTS
ncbi:type II toxin-antitoxin system VapC family toxin [Pararhizobium sp. O133]|uniref:type II toxin-antitoxin system VapC family toxin n=1 Tax=Pararhizobium sp. O133 TaxID=3449278 RepID=UPI003F683CB0